MSRSPWLCEGSPWKTESSFWGWVRGVLRKGWSKHPIKLEYIKRFRKRVPNPNPKGRVADVWGMTCSICKKDTIQSLIEIDHIGDNCNFRGLQDVEKYIAHLFLIDYTSIRPCCKECHSIVSHAQNEGITFEEAKIAKAVIAIMKDKKKCLAMLEEHEYNCKNDKQRRAALTEILTKEK